MLTNVLWCPDNSLGSSPGSSGFKRFWSKYQFGEKTFKSQETSATICSNFLLFLSQSANDAGDDDDDDDDDDVDADVDNDLRVGSCSGRRCHSVILLTR